jgi:hypothetical protein
MRDEKLNMNKYRVTFGEGSNFKVLRTGPFKLFILLTILEMMTLVALLSCLDLPSFAEELSSCFVLNVNCSSCPFMVNLISPPTSTCALTVLKKGLSRISDTFESGCISSTTKSTGTNNSHILSRMFSAMPNGYRTD